MLTQELPVRFHHLKAFGRSAAHGQLARQGVDGEQTYAMERGSGVDELLLGEGNVIGYPGTVRRGKEWEAFQEAHKGYTILTANEYEKAMRMVEAVQASSLAMEILGPGPHRKTMSCEWMGRRCSFTPDSNHAHLVDLKTTVCSDPERFKWQALRMHYAAQLAWYRQNVAIFEGNQPKDAFIVAVESSAPWPVTVLRLTPRALDFGARLVRLWMERLIACEAAGSFPPYCEAIVDLDVPGDDQELDYGNVAEAVG